MHVGVPTVIDTGSEKHRTKLVAVPADKMKFVIGSGRKMLTNIEVCCLHQFYGRLISSSCSAGTHTSRSVECLHCMDVHVRTYTLGKSMTLAKMSFAK